MKRNWEPLDKGERGKWKNWLKTQHSKKEDHGSQFHHFIQIDGEKVEPVTDFIFLGSKITVDGDCSHKIKTLAPWKKRYDKPRQHIKKWRHHFSHKERLRARREQNKTFRVDWPSLKSEEIQNLSLKKPFFVKKEMKNMIFYAFPNNMVLLCSSSPNNPDFRRLK